MLPLFRARDGGGEGPWAFPFSGYLSEGPGAEPFSRHRFPPGGVVKKTRLTRNMGLLLAAQKGGEWRDAGREH